LTGLQTRWCSIRCKVTNGNHKYQDYAAQQARGLVRKTLLIEEAGGSCRECGYDKNYAAMCFHHRHPE
jgi:hypothetical protein